MMIDTLKVRLLMVEKSLNQKKLSELAGIRESTLSYILNGKSKGSSRTWLKIENALNIDEKNYDLQIKKEQTR